MKTMTYKDIANCKHDFCRVPDSDVPAMLEMGWKLCPKKCFKKAKKIFSRGKR